MTRQLNDTVEITGGAFKGCEGEIMGIAGNHFRVKISWYEREIIADINGHFCREAKKYEILGNFLLTRS